ncbi:hypothetical protein [Actinocrispum wychmicini]|uniref:Tetratricopeptide repeat protein n=1 Tax=Actinocrispum wychmicini TaxID=1213861 RepID=A0A4R2K3A4_9PSEU|nr:hypothetical protein [Actinocrispum wychmicini]TCO64248.1 hypothetical protein EV192_10112 [Actinocrispum wychmicini]
MDHPFDARKIMLNDDLHPISQRRTVSLVTALRAAVQERTPGAVDDRKTRDLRAMVDELISRGIDGDSLLRYGLGPELVAAVVAHVVLCWIFPDGIGAAVVLIESSDPVIAADTASGNAWAELLEPVISSVTPVPRRDRRDAETVVRAVSEIVMRVVPWIATASTDDLLMLRAPSVDQLEVVAAGPMLDADTMAEYRWVVDRFATTHVRDWSTSSLHREYRWRQETYPAPCVEALMSDRAVDGRALADEIARRAVDAEPSARIAGPAGLDLALRARLNSSAIQFLQAGRRHAAAALFEFALGESPRDAELINNLGFCLIPVEPRQALTKLEEAERLGYTVSEINLHNRALCYFLLGEHRRALDMICDFWSHARGERGFLWRPDNHEVHLRNVLDSREELAYLAHCAATALHDAEAIEHWSHTMGTISGGEHSG